MRRRLRNNTYRKTPFTFLRFKVSVPTDSKKQVEESVVRHNFSFFRQSYSYKHRLDIGCQHHFSFS
jgi:hypothetical protein